jgi:putative oxidoreductase
MLEVGTRMKNGESLIKKERVNNMKINKLSHWLFNPPLDGPTAIILLRLMAGGVFLWEGILKFIYVNQGVGRFTKLGLPFPQATANMTGGLEIVGGILLITGFLTRAFAIPFVIEMLVAILSTKISLYLGTSPLPLPPVPPQIGLWAVLHEVRSEYAQLMTTMFLLMAGPGRWSLDALLIRETNEGKHPLRDQDKVVYLGYSE